MEGLLAGSGGKNHLTDSSLPLSLRRYCQSFTPLPIIGRVAKPIVSDQTLFEPRLGIFFGVSIFFAPRLCLWTSIFESLSSSNGSPPVEDSLSLAWDHTFPNPNYNYVVEPV